MRREVKIHSVSSDAVSFEVIFKDLNLKYLPHIESTFRSMGGREDLTIESEDFKSVEEAEEWLEKLTMEVRRLVKEHVSLVNKFERLLGEAEV